MVISAIWSILAGQNRGPYIRNPVYIQLMKYLLKVSAIPFHILDSTTLLENGIWRDRRKAFHCRVFTQTEVVTFVFARHGVPRRSRRSWSDVPFAVVLWRVHMQDAPLSGSTFLQQSAPSRSWSWIGAARNVHPWPVS